MPHSRPMPNVGRRCHELRIRDEGTARRVVYRIDPDAIVIIDVFTKKSARTPGQIIEACRKRLARYDRDGATEDES